MPYTERLAFGLEVRRRRIITSLYGYGNTFGFILDKGKKMKKHDAKA
jgi:hypothetical protein